MNIPYQRFNNQNSHQNNNKNNENIVKINGLLQQIGTDSKSFLNKLKSKKSKSIEFLELIDINLDKILENINLENIKKQLNKSKKLFDKLLCQEYLNKIEHKNNKNRLIQQKNTILIKHSKFFVNFSEKILQIVYKNSLSLSIEQLRILLSIQDELIELFKEYYYNKQNKISEDNLAFMMSVKRYIVKNIFLMTPNVKSRNINSLFSESESIYNQVKKMNKLEINSKKKELAAHIMDLAKFIYKKTDVSNKKSFEKSIEELNKLNELYFLIFQKEYNAMSKSRKYSQFSEWNSIIPNRNTYDNLEQKKSYISNFIIKLPYKARSSN
jgi:hypothetical protein